MSAVGGATGHGSEEWAELVVGRALDALEPGDDARLEAHLPACADCRTLLAEMAHVAASLAYAADEVEPPAELLERIQAALPARHATPEGDAMRTDDLADRRVRRRAAGRAHRPSRRLTLGAAGLSAAAALALVGVYTANLHDQRDRARTSLAVEASVISTLQRGSAYSVPLISGGPATGAVVVSGHTIDLVTDGLDKNDASTSQYVLWAATPGRTIQPIRGFDVSSDGLHVVRATVPATMQTPTTFAVSEERGRTLPIIPGRLVLGRSSAS